MVNSGVRPASVAGTRQARTTLIRRAGPTKAGATSGAPAATVKETSMDKNHLDGSVIQINGVIKEAVGRIVGNDKLEAEGKDEQVEGKAQKRAAEIQDTQKS